MNVGVVGVGYVGLVVGACFAEMGHHVICLDIDQHKISLLKSGQVPIYEPGLYEMIKRNSENGRLSFTTDLKEMLDFSLFVFIAVGTPPNEDGSADLSHVLQVAKEIGQNINRYTIIVDKSTVPVGTAQKVKNVIKEELTNRGLNQIEIDVVSNPEFLREGAAIEDFMHPSRIVVGTDHPRIAALMKELYRPLTDQGYPLLQMSIFSAELTKYATNAMLATRISFINEIAVICEATGADIEEVKLGLGSDTRVGMAFLNAGLGYGGSCFPKDVKALIQTGKEYRVELQIVKAVDQVNSQQKQKLLNKVLQFFGEDLHEKVIAIWGLAFKPETDDIREAPAIETIKELRRHGATIHAHDPAAIENTRVLLGNNGIYYFDDLYEAIKNSDALLLITEWKMYQEADLSIVKKRMKYPVLFDGRNQFDPIAMQKAGFVYYSIGRKKVQ
ncbi:UDP-glucose/GDP-mannose dehydrogenase family protein [Tepidibacillus infernus]|uniref:UDP-glucose 6-dehydrogenase n=1 Tax=Tepidibacillus decaturensis TaxID=1413211 RepID=A0A135L4W3_9BACI|nr:UDP-glucose/GDP-mannose dehydrogenase family protein [Tepidibacillus decaturensis]KXG43903.1 UDP-glucose 6-dehydrogenase [Tepidibacillus decaturensis]